LSKRLILPVLGFFGLFGCTEGFLRSVFDKRVGRRVDNSDIQVVDFARHDHLDVRALGLRFIRKHETILGSGGKTSILKQPADFELNVIMAFTDMCTAMWKAVRGVWGNIGCAPAVLGGEIFDGGHTQLHTSCELEIKILVQSIRGAVQGSEGGCGPLRFAG
jgi:hypothetical protein